MTAKFTKIVWTELAYAIAITLITVSAASNSIELMRATAGLLLSVRVMVAFVNVISTNLTRLIDKRQRALPLHA